MATNNSSEERRRRISERGPDRMAVITGRISSLSTPPPPSPCPSSSSSSFPQDVSGTQSSISLSDDHRMSHPDNINASPEGTEDAFDASLLKHVSVDEISRENKPDIGSPEEPKLSKCGTSIEAIQTPLDESVKIQQLGAPVVQQRASIDEEPHLKQWRHQFRFFTSRRIHSCIVASENTRVICALIIALLVVLSHVDQRLFGRNIVKSKSVVASRPLYMLLLTDVTIVLARLYLEKRSEFDEAQKERVAPHGDRRNWEKAEKVLERGLVVYQTIRAIFIDCSVYAVVVICGLSVL